VLRQDALLNCADNAQDAKCYVADQPACANDWQLLCVRL
jgi:hypothetical protein